MAHRVGPFVALSLLLPLVLVAQEHEPLDVYVLSRTIESLSREERYAQKTELKKRSSDLTRARKALLKKLKATHGKIKDWPAEARAAYARAKEAESMAKAEIKTLNNSSREDVLESVAAIQRAIAGGYEVERFIPFFSRHVPVEFLRPARSEAEADLTVDVMSYVIGGRYDSCILIVRLSPAETLVPEKLEEIVRDGKSPDWSGRALHDYRADEPFWMGEVDACPGYACETVRILEAFVKENYVALTASRR